MKRTLLIFVGVVVAVIVAGLLVFDLLVPNELDPGPAEQPAPSAETRTPPDGQDGPQPPAVEPGTIAVIGVSGAVKKRGPENDWLPVRQGDRLERNESIRTDRRASARLKVDGRSAVELTERGELEIAEISETIHRFKLVRGALRVDYAPDPQRVLRIESARSAAVAESKGGRFALLNADGVVSVATTSGQVKLSANERTVSVDAGQTSLVAPGAAPRPPRAIPKSILLRVVNPKSRVQRSRFIVVRGRTEPGARVWINDLPARVDRRGRFRLRVKLREGRNRLVVFCQDVAGNKRSHDLGVVIVDPSAPVERMQIQWGKGQ